MASLRTVDQNRPGGHGIRLVRLPMDIRQNRPFIPERACVQDVAVLEASASCGQMSGTAHSVAHPPSCRCDAPAFLICWNRQREGHSAGRRTFPLAAVASYAPVCAAEGLARHARGHCPNRRWNSAGGRFIGNGAILKNDGEVSGLANAGQGGQPMWRSAFGNVRYRRGYLPPMAEC
jgi:hypothetical protein